MTDARIILRNLTANWVGHGVNLAVMFFLSPFILHTLGITEYGVWQLLTVLTGYMGVLDLGVRASTGRYIILYLGQEEYRKVDETIRTGLGLYSMLSGLILASGFILGLVFPIVFPSVPQEYHMTVAILLPVLAINIWISAINTILSSLLAAYERFDLARGSDLIVLAVRTICTIITIKLGMGIIGLAVAVIACNVVGMIINLILSYRIHYRLKLWPLMLKRKRMVELYKYGIGAFIIAASVRIIGQTDLILVGNLISINSVAVYSVGAMLINYSGFFITQVETTYFPTLQKAVARENLGEVRLIIYRQVNLSLIIGLLMYIGYLSFGKIFIKLWMFHPDTFPLESVEKAYLVMVVLSCAKLLLLLNSFSKSILAATGYIGFSARMRVIEAIINLVLSIIFVVLFNWDLVGIAAGTFVSHFLIQTIIVPHYACQKAGLNWFHILFGIGGRGLIAGLLFALICFCVQRFFIPNSWVPFLLQVGLTTLAYIPIVWFLIVPANDRNCVKNKLQIFFPVT
jgi:O-antigen/teichoic acid export membrane protein